jgi:hypothetical protein
MTDNLQVNTDMIESIAGDIIKMDDGHGAVLQPWVDDGLRGQENKGVGGHGRASEGQKMAALLWCGLGGGVPYTPNTSLFDGKGKGRRNRCEGGARGALRSSDDAGAARTARRNSGAAK